MTFLSKHVRISALLLLCVACSTDKSQSSVSLTRQALEPCGTIPDCTPYACEFADSCYSLCHYDSQCAANYVCNNLCASPSWSCGDQEDDLTCLPILYNEAPCTGAYAKNPVENACFAGCDHDEQCNPGYVCNGTCVAAGGSGGGGAGGAGAGGAGAGGAGAGGAGAGGSGGVACVNAGAGGMIDNADFYPASRCLPVANARFALDGPISATPFQASPYDPQLVFCPFIHRSGNTTVAATARVSGSVDCHLHVQKSDGTLQTSPARQGVGGGGTLTFASQSFPSGGAAAYLFATCSMATGSSLVGFSVTEAP